MWNLSSPKVVQTCPGDLLYVFVAGLCLSTVLHRENDDNGTAYLFQKGMWPLLRPLFYLGLLTESGAYWFPSDSRLIPYWLPTVCVINCLKSAWKQLMITGRSPLLELAFNCARFYLRSLLIALAFTCTQELLKTPWIYMDVRCNCPEPYELIGVWRAIKSECPVGLFIKHVCMPFNLGAFLNLLKNSRACWTNTKTHTRRSRTVQQLR